MRIILLLVLCFNLSGCVSVESIARNDLNFVNLGPQLYPPTPKSAKVIVLFQSKPHKDYELIGEITGIIRRGNKLRAVLAAKARQVGGDGVIDIDLARADAENLAAAEQAQFNCSRNKARNSDTKVCFYDNLKIKAKIIKYK